MIPSVAARCRVRAFGTAFAAAAAVVLGVLTTVLSDSGWHVTGIWALLMAVAVAGVALVVGHLRLASGDVPRAVGMLRAGAALGAVAVIGLLVVGGLAVLLLARGGASAWVATWLTALLAAGPVWFAAQGLRDAAVQPGQERPA